MKKPSLDELINYFCSKKGIDIVNLDGQDRYSFVVESESEERLVIISDVDRVSEQVIISIVLAHEKDINRNLLLKLLEWNADVNQNCPGSFCFDAVSQALILKDKISLNSLSKQMFTTFMDKMIAYFYYRKNQIDNLKKMKIKKPPVEILSRRFVNKLNFK